MPFWDADSLITSGLLPPALLRAGIRYEIKDRIRTESRGKLEDQLNRKLALIQSFKTRPIVEEAKKANEEHYEVDAGLFKASLGPNLKYSSCLYDENFEGTLEAAEERMLDLYVERAGMVDGMRVLDLGCGWGSYAVYMAKRFRASKIVGLSNSSRQREVILERARSLGLENLDIVTANVGDWEAEESSYDRVISIEMFEHMKNYELLLAKISRWLKPGGKLFVHIFGHRSLAYEYGTEGWMAQYFFRNGNMMSGDLLLWFQKDLKIESMWFIDGRHYAKTCEDWLRTMKMNKNGALEALAQTYGEENKWAWYYRWQVFYMACAELFAYDGGNTFGVFHYLFQKP